MPVETRRAVADTVTAPPTAVALAKHGRQAVSIEPLGLMQFCAAQHEPAKWGQNDAIEK